MFNVSGWPCWLLFSLLLCAHIEQECAAVVWDGEPKSISRSTSMWESRDLLRATTTKLECNQSPPSLIRLHRVWFYGKKIRVINQNWLGDLTCKDKLIQVSKILYNISFPPLCRSMESKGFQDDASLSTPSKIFFAGTVVGHRDLWCGHRCGLSLRPKKRYRSKEGPGCHVMVCRNRISHKI